MPTAITIERKKPYTDFLKNMFNCEIVKINGVDASREDLTAFCQGVANGSTVVVAVGSFIKAKTHKTLYITTAE